MTKQTIQEGKRVLVHKELWFKLSYIRKGNTKAITKCTGIELQPLKHD